MFSTSTNHSVRTRLSNRLMCFLFIIKLILRQSLPEWFQIVATKAHLHIEVLLRLPHLVEVGGGENTGLLKHKWLTEQVVTDEEGPETGLHIQGRVPIRIVLLQDSPEDLKVGYRKAVVTEEVFVLWKERRQVGFGEDAATLEIFNAVLKVIVLQDGAEFRGYLVTRECALHGTLWISGLTWNIFFI